MRPPNEVLVQDWKAEVILQMATEKHYEGAQNL